mmetsp:Transcript_73855/g.159836  ORF Transcript_73855/g.159836 Transcript_73855/m.159836 type:complete len:222 (-) Transcript_73855:33-698(-)
MMCWLQLPTVIAVVTESPSALGVTSMLASPRVRRALNACSSMCLPWKCSSVTPSPTESRWVSASLLHRCWTSLHLLACPFPWVSARASASAATSRAPRWVSLRAHGVRVWTLSFPSALLRLMEASRKSPGRPILPSTGRCWGAHLEAGEWCSTSRLILSQTTRSPTRCSACTPGSTAVSSLSTLLTPSWTSWRRKRWRVTSLFFSPSIRHPGRPQAETSGT